MKFKGSRKSINQSSGYWWVPTSCQAMASYNLVHLLYNLEGIAIRIAEDKKLAAIITADNLRGKLSAPLFDGCINGFNIIDHKMEPDFFTRSTITPSLPNYIQTKRDIGGFVLRPAIAATAKLSSNPTTSR